MSAYGIQVEPSGRAVIPALSSASLIIPEPWVQKGLCTETDPEMFFPEKGGSTRQAKSICGGCDVREQCLEYAMRTDERFGIWGGLSERERRQLRPKVERPMLTRTPQQEADLEQMVAENFANTQIADRLGVSAHTVMKWRRELGLPASRRRGSRRAVV